MLSIRDSVEPEDSFEDGTLPPYPEPPPIEANPVVFDLPSTASGQPSSTTTQGELPKSANRQRNYHPDEYLTGPLIDISGLSSESLAQASFTKRSPQVGESALVGTMGRRNSMTAIDVPTTPKRMDRASSVDLEESPAIRRKRQKSAQRIEDSDNDDVVDQKKAEKGLVRPSGGGRGDQIEVYMDESVAGDSSPRKLLVAVEIPSKKQAKAKRGRLKKPLGEITAAENTSNRDLQARLTPVPTPLTSFPPRPQTPPSPATDVANVEKEDIENVVLGKVPAKAVELEYTPHGPIEKMAPVMSAVRPMNVATILSKSPTRPSYRVGLSRKVNIEPLHGYLKRNSS